MTRVSALRPAFECGVAAAARSGCGCASRRGFLRTLGAAAAAAAVPAAAQTPAGGGRIDTHFHYYPAPLSRELEEWWLSNPARGPLQAGVRDWSVSRTLELMDESGMQTGVCSLSIPGARLKPDLESTKRIARVSNEFGAQMGRDHPRRFGLFATLPFPDVDACLKEIEYSLDTLKADGIGMMTSYDGKYPGDKAFAPIFEELNRRNAVIYFHPNSPACCGGVIAGISEAFLEYPYDTGRAILSLLLSGTFSRASGARYIFSHTGGPIIMLAGRVENMISRRADLQARVPEGVPAVLKRLYYDTANSAYPQNLAALLAYAPLSQVLFGSDAPYYTIAENLAELSKAGLTDGQRSAIERDNALALFPRLRG